MAFTTTIENKNRVGRFKGGKVAVWGTFTDLTEGNDDINTGLDDVLVGFACAKNGGGEDISAAPQAGASEYKLRLVGAAGASGDDGYWIAFGNVFTRGDLT